MRPDRTPTHSIQSAVYGVGRRTPQAHASDNGIRAHLLTGNVVHAADSVEEFSLFDDNLQNS